MRIGGILTAMVTPFDANGDVDEDAAVRLMRHLLENGSDGLVIAGSTGEAATLTDDEKSELWALAVRETSDDAFIVAGTGTYDTRHTVELTERAHEAGVDAMLVVTPYYVKPNRRGLVEHFRAVAAATDLPVILYNIPSRCAVDMPNDLLADLFEALAMTTNPIPIKAALNMTGHGVGGLRLPLVEASHEEAAVIRAALERHGLLAPHRSAV
jgi:4-hydroxy-tetrahydrodipicolinate synthase